MNEPTLLLSAEQIISAERFRQRLQPDHLAEVFGRRTRDLIRTGRDPYEAARLACSYAFKADPRLRRWETP